MTEETKVWTTEIRILQPDGKEERRTVELPEGSNVRAFLDALEAIVLPILDCPHMEHVNVFTSFDYGPERYLDMFVDEDGIDHGLHGLPINMAATAIYHNNLVAHGKTHLATGDPIFGTAILFRDKVWF